MDEDRQRINLIKIISGAIIVGFTLIIVYAIISAALTVKPLKISNLNQIETNLTNGQINELEDFLWQAVEENENITEASETISALIRPSSYQETDSEAARRYQFLVDIDEYKLTYQVSFSLVGDKSFYEQPDISCPATELMKYPETYCKVGRSSTTSITIGSLLPYEFRLDSGELVIVSTGYDENGKDFLNVRVSSCGDVGIINKARAEVEKWIVSQELDPNNYEIKIPEFCDGEAS